MTKDIYKWWSRKKLKGEILNLKLTYNDILNTMLKTQEENNRLRKAYNICDEANIHLKEEIKVLRKELNERSYVDLEDQLIKAKEIIKEYMRFEHMIGTCSFYSEEYEKTKIKAEQFLNSEVEK